VLRNLSVTGQRSHAGLFGYVGSLGTAPVIKNLGLENVLINTTAPSLNATAGGLVGDFFRTSPTVSNCYVTGSITATGQTAIAAGLIGYSDSSGGDMIVTDCYNGAKVSAIYEKSNSSGDTHAGGIIGVAYNAKTINNCHNTGEITVSAVNMSTAAGIAASLPFNNKLISNCSNTGKVSASTKGGVVIGAAGIVGRYDGGLNTDMSHIVNCWNTGDISVFLDSDNTSTDVFAGGIGGRTHQNAVSDCYNTGNISATSNGHLNGTAGGIVGRNSTESSVRRCYSTGNITASQNPGAIVGLAVEGSFAWACYWNSDATYTQDSRVLASADKKGVGSGEDTTTRRTAAQLKQEASYDHFFSFVKTWGFKDGENSGYPVLRVAYPSLPYVSTVATPDPQYDFTVPKSKIDPPDPDSIPISTREELDDIRNNLDGKFHLTADIDLSGVDWEPIGEYTHGNSNEPFTGVLDGQGHVIIGLTTQAFAISTSNRYGGLFAYAAKNAVIKNLGMEDICLYTTGWNCWSGALCAATGDSVQIINCYATGQASVGSAKSTYGACIGGLIGYVSSGSLEAIDCHSSVTLTAKSDDALNAGGICGIMRSGRLYNCYNTGSVTAIRFASASAGHPSAGGVAGQLTGSGELVQCGNTGDVYLSNGNSYGYAGGVVGYINTNGKVSRSSNTGDVFLTSTTAGPTLNAGGVVGYNAGKVSDSYNLAGVKTEVKSTADATKVFSGGVAGSNAYSGAELARCYSSGSVSGSNPGGVAGSTVASTTITECYWNKDMPHYVNGNVMNGRGIFTNGGTGTATTLTTASMKQAASFTGFDFAGVWKISGSQNGGYPALQQKPTPYTVTMSTSGSSTYPGTITGGGGYAKGETVTITAGPSTSTGYRFKEWTASSDEIVFANKNSASTTFTMITGHVTIKAVYEKIPSYYIKINGYSSSYKHQVGATVTIVAPTAPSGKKFREWRADKADIVFADRYSSTTTFVMPERDGITLEALWDDVYYTITVNGGTASV
ncbi:hypothetical protein LJC60_10745, partial [Ruminococcaceae bacterium OttesenSCG-928-D13]|nr:hypothetical protein [Ruminococcaceae bacterium OttesenSCG-928-D13]